MNEERYDCPRCRSAGSIENGLCQVCLADLRLLQSDVTQIDLAPVPAPDLESVR